MRRTVKDIEHLYECYCRAWQCEDLERTKRISDHGWVQNVWVRDYDDVVRMSPTEQGKELALSYRDYKTVSSDDFSLTEFLTYADIDFDK